MKIALILFGISYFDKYYNNDGNYYKIDYRYSIENYKEYIYKHFIKNEDDNIDVFLSTYHSEMDIELIKDYKPVKHIFLNYDNNANTRSLKRRAKNKNITHAIELFNNYENKNNYDLCIITRFDLFFKIKFENTNLDIKKFNCVGRMEYKNILDDNLYIFPINYFNKFYNIIKIYGQKISHHYLEDLFKKEFGEINFIYNENKSYK